MLKLRVRDAAMIDGAVLMLGAVVLVWRFLALHARLGPHVAPAMALLSGGHRPYPGAVGWWNWWDQGWYEKAAVAWANGITATDWHWYLPGYPLLGAPFARLTPTDAFLLPDLICLLLAFGICAGLGRQLLDAGRWSTVLGAGAFFFAVAGSDTVLQEWVIPWSTTPQAVGFLGALLAVARVRDARRPELCAGLAGLAAGVVVGCRPADGAVILGAVSGGMACLVPVRRWRKVMPALLAGVGVPVLITGAAYAAVWGWRPSLYLIGSGRVGFEFAQLPLRWVSLMIDPNPVFPRGRGLAEGFPWLVPGLAGLAAALVAPGRAGRVMHTVVAGAALADLMLFLSYRDLHPDGVWLFGLHHYFAALLPLFALYAARFGVVGIRAAQGQGRPMVAVLAGVLLAAGVFCWHLELEPWGPLEWEPSGGVVLPHGLQPLEAVAMVPGKSMSALPLVIVHAETAAGRVLEMGADLAIPDPGSSNVSLPVLPLRRLPAVRTVIRITSPVRLDRALQPILFKQRIRWGLPCGWRNHLGPLPQ